MDPASSSLANAMPGREDQHMLKRSLFLLALVCLSIYALIKAQGILLPLAFAAVFAMLLERPVSWLSARMPRGLAIGAVTFLLFALVISIFALAGQQIASFSDSIPQIREQALSLLESAQQWISGRFNVSQSRLENTVDQRLDDLPDQIGNQANSFIGTLSGFLADFFLFFVYLILLLAARTRLRNFVLQLSEPGHRKKTADTLDQVRKVAGHYLWGRFILVSILFGIYLAGFTWAGLSYAFVIAVIGAALSVIPYFGNIVAAVLVVVVAAFSEDVQSTMLIGLSTMAFAQIIESYVLEPLVVGGEVDLNPLVTVVAVVAFSSIWGLGGTILAIPLVGILRQVLEVLPKGRPWAYLLSDSKASEIFDDQHPPRGSITQVSSMPHTREEAS